MNRWQIEIERRLQLLESTGNAGVEVLREKIERLIAYFEKHARENDKRAENLEKKIKEDFNLCSDFTGEDRSSYYLSGKASAYERAAEKVRELLGEDKDPYPAYAKYRECAKPQPKSAEKWIVESYTRGMWQRSQDVPQVFSSKAEAIQAMAEAEKRFGVSVTRRARRIDAPERWIVECKGANRGDKDWSLSGDPGVNGTFPSKVEAEAAIAVDPAVLKGHLIRRARRID